MATPPAGALIQIKALGAHRSILYIEQECDMLGNVKAQELQSNTWRNAWSAEFEAIDVMNERVFICLAHSMTKRSHDVKQYMQPRLRADSVMRKTAEIFHDVANAAGKICSSVKASADYSETTQKFSRCLFGRCNQPQHGRASRAKDNRIAVG